MTLNRDSRHWGKRKRIPFGVCTLDGILYFMPIREKTVDPVKFLSRTALASISTTGKDFIYFLSLYLTKICSVIIMIGKDKIYFLSQGCSYEQADKFQGGV